MCQDLCSRWQALLPMEAAPITASPNITLDQTASPFLSLTPHPWNSGLQEWEPIPTPNPIQTEMPPLLSQQALSQNTWEASTQSMWRKGRREHV